MPSRKQLMIAVTVNRMRSGPYSFLLAGRQTIKRDVDDTRHDPADALYIITIMFELDRSAMLAVALAEARKGLAEGGIPIGAAIFDATGKLVGSGHNRRVQNDDPSMHGETDAFRNGGRQRSYRSLTIVTTLAPCWYCSGLVRQFGFGSVVVGESRNFQGGTEWLRSLGVKVVDLDSSECASLLGEYIRRNPG